MADWTALAAATGTAERGVDKATSRSTRSADIMFDKAMKDEDKLDVANNRVAALNLALSPGEKMAKKYVLDPKTKTPLEVALTPAEQSAVAGQLGATTEGIFRGMKTILGTDNTAASSIPGSSSSAAGPLASAGPMTDEQRIASEGFDRVEDPLRGVTLDEGRRLRAESDKFFRDAGMENAPEPIRAMVAMPGGQDKFLHALAFASVFGLQLNGDMLEALSDYDGYIARKNRAAEREDMLFNENMLSMRSGREMAGKQMKLAEEQLKATLAQTAQGQKLAAQREKFDRLVQITKLQEEIDRGDREFNALDLEEKRQVQGVIAGAMTSWKTFLEENPNALGTAFMSNEDSAKRLLEAVDDWALQNGGNIPEEYIGLAKAHIIVNQKHMNDTTLWEAINVGALAGSTAGGLATAWTGPGAGVGVAGGGILGSIGGAISYAARGPQTPEEGTLANAVARARLEIEAARRQPRPAGNVRPNRLEAAKKELAALEDLE